MSKTLKKLNLRNIPKFLFRKKLFGNHKKLFKKISENYRGKVRIGHSKNDVQRKTFKRMTLRQWHSLALASLALATLALASLALASLS